MEIAILAIIMIAPSAAVTSVFFVRHCEKESNMPQADLSDAGHLRAAQLAYALQFVKFHAIFTTNVPRAISTAEPLSKHNNVTAMQYNYYDTRGMAGILRSKFEGHNVLVVGHSDNIPSMIQNLGGSMPYSDIPLSEYDNLFIVTLHNQEHTTVLHLKYGQVQEI